MEGRELKDKMGKYFAVAIILICVPICIWLFLQGVFSKPCTRLEVIVFVFVYEIVSYVVEKFMG